MDLGLLLELRSIFLSFNEDERPEGPSDRVLDRLALSSGAAGLGDRDGEGEGDGDRDGDVLSILFINI
ncbi:hypothetical protein AYO37_00995 [Opitutia bacterium SCGC AG-212-L18]|nr:hypothetical protein AYO37_00995 [Opitutae bacterium SCGC AG-212-L18]